MTGSKSSAGDGSVSSPEDPAPAPPPKKKRNLPGMPDPKAEVIALSPKSLLATNRFVCEICSKGFQRDQNLQLHRRGHNLPWKLRQRNGKEEVIKRVYVCPELGCVHHNPSRALGDLTGIKKHFCRKHGEKKWKCEKCSKSYAVLSDWKAHSKTCGTREYRCGCGILFSRRDSFITHRAFCDALAEENARPETKTTVQGSARPLVDEEVEAPTIAASPVQLMLPAPAEQQEPKNATELLQYPPLQQPSPPASTSVNSYNSSGTTASGGSSNSSPAATSASTSLFASLFASPGAAAANCASFSDLIGAMSRPARGAAASAASIIEPLSLCLSTDSAAPLLPLDPPHLYSFPQTSPHMSATALLQKAAEMGAASPSSATALLQKAAQMGAASSTSFLRSLGLATSSFAGGSQLENISAGDGSLQWKPLEKHPLREQPEPLLSAGLGLGLAYDGGANAVAAALPELMMGSSPLFGPKPATLDFLGRSWSSPPADAWDDRKPSSSSPDILELAAGKNKNNSNDPFGLFN